MAVTAPFVPLAAALLLCCSALASASEVRARRQATPPSPHALRVTFHRMDSASATPLTSAQSKRLDAVLAAAGDWARSTLTLDRPATDPLRLNRACAGVVQYSPAASTQLLQYFCRNPAACLNATSCGPAVPRVPAEHLAKCQLCFVRPGGILSCDSDPSDSSPDSVGVPDSDVIVYVVRDCALVPAGQLTSGESCLRYGPTDRPNGGWMAVCPERLRLDTAAMPHQVSEVQRELVRILGVSRRELPFWRDASNVARTPRDQQNMPIGVAGTTLAEVVATTAGSNPQPRRYYELRTPAVVTEARRHFGCQSLSGIPMEDYGNRSDLFEMRVVGQSELLTLRSFLPSPLLVPVVSRLTLSALADTGWYTPDYMRAFALHHGSARGCAFVLSDCLGYVNQSQPDASLLSHPFLNATVLASFGVAEAPWSVADPQPSSVAALPFCNVVRSSATARSSFARCSPTRQRITACNLLRSANTGGGGDDSVPRYFRHASGGDVVATDPVSDFCPTFSSFLSNSSADGRPPAVPADLSGFVARCDDIAAAPAVNWALEQYSASSLCVEHTRPWRRLPNGEDSYDVQTAAANIMYYGAGCYRRECFANGSLRLWVAGTSLLCNTAGQRVEFSLTVNTVHYTGGVVCPSPNDSCSAARCPANCSWHGDCWPVAGSYRCHCYAGYTAADCGTLADGSAVDVTSSSSSDPDIGAPIPVYFTMEVIANIAVAGAVAFGGLVVVWVTQCYVPGRKMRKLRTEARRRQATQDDQVQSAGRMELERMSSITMRANDSIEVIDSTHGASYPRQPGYTQPVRYPRQPLSQKPDVVYAATSEEQVIEISEDGIAPTAMSNGRPGGAIELGLIQHQLMPATAPQSAV